MKFVKQSFMGIELDILTGHPEHRLMFIASQVARAAGLKNPSGTVFKAQNLTGFGGVVRIEDVSSTNSVENIPLMPNGNQYNKKTVLFTQGQSYQMLLRGHAPTSEPFRKWVTEEVLPSIRKTGKYNAEESTNPIALAIMDELKALRGEIMSLRQELQAKTFSLEAPVAVEVSPYEGQRVARQ